VLRALYTSISEYEETGNTQRSSREGASARLSCLASTFIRGSKWLLCTGNVRREANLETPPPANFGVACVLGRGGG
jgi:hypothetical protein